MNLDERLEALTQSVELLASMHRDTERQSQEHQRQFQEHQRQFQEHQRQFQEHQMLVTEVLLSIRDSVRRLTVISEVHQDRLDDHERRLSQQS